MRNIRDYEPTRSYQDDLDVESIDPFAEEYDDDLAERPNSPFDWSGSASSDQMIDDLEAEVVDERLTPDEEVAEDRTP